MLDWVLNMPLNSIDSLKTVTNDIQRRKKFKHNIKTWFPEWQEQNFDQRNGDF